MNGLRKYGVFMQGKLFSYKKNDIICSHMDELKALY